MPCYATLRCPPSHLPAWPCLHVQQAQPCSLGTAARASAAAHAQLCCAGPWQEGCQAVGSRRSAGGAAGHSGLHRVLAPGQAQAHGPFQGEPPESAHSCATRPRWHYSQRPGSMCAATYTDGLPESHRAGMSVQRCAHTRRELNAILLLVQGSCRVTPASFQPASQAQCTQPASSTKTFNNHCSSCPLKVFQAVRCAGATADAWHGSPRWPAERRPGALRLHARPRPWQPGGLCCW